MSLIGPLAAGTLTSTLILAEFVGVEFWILAGERSGLHVTHYDPRLRTTCISQIPPPKGMRQPSEGILSPHLTCTGAAIAGVYRAAGKKMVPFEALTWGVGQTFCVVIISFLRILATL